MAKAEKEQERQSYMIGVAVTGRSIRRRSFGCQIRKAILFFVSRDSGHYVSGISGNI